jgi:hypothetical protein
MKLNSKLTITPLLAGMAVMAGGSPAFAQSLLVNDGLPTANVNSGTADQSNVAWADNESTATPANFIVPGGSFSIGGSGNYTLTDIRVWDVNGPTTGLSLLGGLASSTMTVNPISTSYTVTPTTYPNGQTYQGSSGDFLPLYQLDFSVDINLAAGQTFDFFLNGPFTFYSDEYVNPFLAASASPSSPFLWLDVGDPAYSDVPTAVTWFSGTGGGTLDGGTAGPGWNQDSVADVQVFGTPDGGSALMLLGGSFAGLAWLRRKM